MAAPTLYYGPGKVAHTFAGTVYILHAEGEAGMVNINVNTKVTPRYNASYGYTASTIDDVTGRITLTPFDCWALLPVLYPTYLGVTTGSNSAALLCGTRPFDVAAGAANGCAPTLVWTPDGRTYRAVRTAIIRPPGMHLGVGKPLFTAMDIGALMDPALAIGAGGELFDTSAHAAGSAGTTGIVESSASDPSGSGTVPAYGTTDFINGHWTGAWGAISNFTALDAEDGWELVVDARYSMKQSQGRTYHCTFDGVRFMVKARLTGPTHTQLLAKVTALAQGAVLTEGSAADLVLSGPSSKTLTLKNCEAVIEAGGFEFGGTKLGTGEVAFVPKLVAGSGAVPAAALVFSA